MSDTLNPTHWAEATVEKMTKEIMGLIDCGMEMESAVDYAFENSVLGNAYKMRVLENVAHYRHEHRFVLDCVTGKYWCATCQQFRDQ